MSARSDRYRQVVEVLSVHGFGFAVGAAGWSGRFPFRHGLPGHEKGRTYAQPEHLRLALEELGATFVKLGQILSTRPDILPPDYVAELAKLQDAVPPVPAAAVMSALSDELRESPLLESLDPTPLASASIGQVHAARMAGTDVVVKIRRPGIVETVHTDLEILEDLAERMNRRSALARDHDVVGIAREFSSTFRNELDYLREAHNAERVAANFAADPDVHIPRVFWEATTSRVLTLERVRGIKASDLAALDAAGVDRREVAKRAARVLCKMVFEDGFFHADPHPGNFFIQPNGTLGIIDFGMVGELSETLRGGLVTLLVALVRADLEGTTQALLGLSTGSGPADSAALQADLAPLVATFGGLSLGELATTQLITQLVGLVRRHRLHLPHDLVLLFKTLIMAEGLGQQLDPDFRIAGVVAPFAERLATEQLTPEALLRRALELGRQLLRPGASGPRDVRTLAEAMERAALDLHLSATELERFALEARRAGNRLVAAVLGAALLQMLSRIVAADPTRRRPLHRTLTLGGATMSGAVAGYLLRPPFCCRQRADRCTGRRAAAGPEATVKPGRHGRWPSRF